MRTFIPAAALVLIIAVASYSSTQQKAEAHYLPVGLFIGAIEEGARIFTPVRLLPVHHPEAVGHEFPTVQQLHRGEDELLVLIGLAAGLRLGATLQRYPTQPDTLWPYAPFVPPPVDAFRHAQIIRRSVQTVPIPGLRVVALVDGAPIAFIVDTRGLSLAARQMRHATTMGLDMSRAQFLTALEQATKAVPDTHAVILVYDP